jgi:hypothetical protein
MPYLTQEEYAGFSLTDVGDKFGGLEVRAELALNQLTMQFYKRHDLDTDTSMRRDAFKLAIALQVEYLARTGALTMEDQRMVGSITSQSIGGTSVSVGSSGDSATSTATTGVCDDARAALSGTGLLYRGIGHGGGRRC